MTSEVFGSRMEVSFSPAAALMAAVLSFVTVLLAAHGPAKRMSKVLPIEAVRGEQYSISVKKAKSHPVLTKHFGFLGEIAANSVNAGRKLYHGCVCSGISMRFPGVGADSVYCSGAFCDQWDLYAGFQGNQG